MYDQKGRNKVTHILEAIAKIDAVSKHLEMLLTHDMYSVKSLIQEVEQHKEILNRIYGGETNEKNMD